MTKRRSFDPIYWFLMLVHTFALAESRESTACSVFQDACNIHQLTCAEPTLVSITNAAVGYKPECPLNLGSKNCTGDFQICCGWGESDTIVRLDSKRMSALRKNCSEQSACYLPGSEMGRGIMSAYTYTKIEYTCIDKATFPIGAIVVCTLVAINVIVIAVVLIVWYVIKRRETRKATLPRLTDNDGKTQETTPHYFIVESSVSLPRRTDETTTAMVHNEPQSRDITRTPLTSRARELPSRTMGSNSIRSIPANDNYYHETAFNNNGSAERRKGEITPDRERKDKGAKHCNGDRQKPEITIDRDYQENGANGIDRSKIKVAPDPEYSEVDRTRPRGKRKPEVKQDREFKEYCAKNNPYRKKSDSSKPEVPIDLTLTDKDSHGITDSHSHEVPEEMDSSFMNDIDNMLQTKGIRVLNDKQRVVMYDRIDKMRR